MKFKTIFLLATISSVFSARAFCDFPIQVYSIVSCTLTVADTNRHTVLAEKTFTKQYDSTNVDHEQAPTEDVTGSLMGYSFDVEPNVDADSLYRITIFANKSAFQATLPGGGGFANILTPNHKSIGVSCGIELPKNGHWSAK